MRILCWDGREEPVACHCLQLRVYMKQRGSNEATSSTMSDTCWRRVNVM